MSTTNTPPQRPLRATPAEIRSGLTFYKIAAILTGTFLLLLCVEMILKYAFHYEVHIGSLNVSKTVLIIHGWLFVVYLLADFNLFNKLRWPLSKFLLVALGGVIPFLSFFLESKVHREVEAQIGEIETAASRY